MSDNLSETPANRRRDNAAVDDRQTTDARLAQICYILVCLHILFFNYLIVIHWDTYIALILEDGWVENLTAVAFLLAGIALFAAAWTERRVFPRCAYILGGAALAFFAAEEISWGQRIIGFETPAFLMDLNVQGEFNIHNIPEANDAVFGTLWNVSHLLGIAGLAAFFCRKERVFGMPTPPILLILALLLMITYTTTEGWIFPDFLGSILFWQRGVYLLLLMFALFSRNAMLFVTTVASMSLTLAVAYLDQHNRLVSSQELMEYMLALIALFYALVALPDQGAARRMVAAAVAALKPAAAPSSIRINPRLDKIGVPFSTKSNAGYLTPWTAFCALIIAGSLGSASIVYLDARADVAAFKETLMLAQSVEPMARSNFDLYLDGRDLRYFKQPCDLTDVRAPFFLNVFPANALALAVADRQFGFEKIAFDFDKRRGVMLDGVCAAMVRLPAYYEIASVSTGQYIIEDDGSTTNIWLVEFPVGDK